MIRNKDFDWESEFHQKFGHDIPFVLGIASNFTEKSQLELFDQLKAFISKVRQEAIDETRQQLLKAVEEIECSDEELVCEGLEHICKDQVIDLLQESDSDKAKDNMEGDL